VSWFDAVLFCNWLSRKEGRAVCYGRTGESVKVLHDGKEKTWETWVCDFGAAGYRLPTEAEWEYACRAGTTTRFSFGGDPEHLVTHGFYRMNSRAHAWPVGTALPNLWGLFDVHGNIGQWCWDWYGPYGADAVDPRGPLVGVTKAFRGGGWYNLSPEECQSAFRFNAGPDERGSYIGLRVVCGAGGSP
jgi:formylglycine-generating enzyme required for sulfatase activity